MIEHSFPWDGCQRETCEQESIWGSLLHGSP